MAIRRDPLGFRHLGQGTDPATTVVLRKVPNTLQLAVGAYVFAMVMGIPLGIFSAIWRGTMLDLFARGFALLGQAMPGFWLGIMLILIFAVQLGWFPPGEKGDLRSLVFTLHNARMVRSRSPSEIDPICNVGNPRQRVREACTRKRRFPNDGHH